MTIVFFTILTVAKTRLVTFETLITILTIENLNSDNLCDLTIKSDTGQHSQFLQCFIMASHIRGPASRCRNILWCVKSYFSAAKTLEEKCRLVDARVLATERKVHLVTKLVTAGRCSFDL